MRLLSASLRDFRNLDEVHLKPGPRATVLVGSNGQGKTNTLEALYYATALRPLRGSRLSELIRFGARMMEVRTVWQLPGGPREFVVKLASGQRILEMDGKKVSSVDDYFGQATVVAFTPDDLVLVKGAPDERRRFLDRAVFARWPAFLSESRDYARALKSRNRLLRERSDPELRAAFDVQLARLGARIWRRRLDLLGELTSHVEAAFEAVARLADPINLRYRTAAVSIPADADLETLEETLLEGLSARLSLDEDRRFTSVGPHADDLVISIGDRPARLYGSQGQQRATVLALKIGEIENLWARLGEYPLLLLDDVSSELDPERNSFLMRYLRSLETQVVLTTTDVNLVKAAAGDDAVIYDVVNGAIKESTR